MDLSAVSFVSMVPLQLFLPLFKEAVGSQPAFVTDAESERQNVQKHPSPSSALGSQVPLPFSKLVF